MGNYDTINTSQHESPQVVVSSHSSGLEEEPTSTQGLGGALKGTKRPIDTNDDVATQPKRPRVDQQPNEGGPLLDYEFTRQMGVSVLLIDYGLMQPQQHTWHITPPIYTLQDTTSGPVCYLNLINSNIK